MPSPILNLTVRSVYDSHKPTTKQINGTQYGCHDSLRNGLRNISEELVLSHPLEEVLGREGREKEMENTLFLKAMMLGRGMQEKYKRDLKAVSAIQRMGGISSSGTLASVIEGKDCEIDFSDYLSRQITVLCEGDDVK